MVKSHVTKLVLGTRVADHRTHPATGLSAWSTAELDFELTIIVGVLSPKCCGLKKNNDLGSVRVKLEETRLELEECFEMDLPNVSVFPFAFVRAQLVTRKAE